MTSRQICNLCISAIHGLYLHDLLKCRESLSHVKLCSNESDFIKIRKYKNPIVIHVSMSRQSNYASKYLSNSYSTFSSIMVEDSLLPPFVSGIIYYIIHIVSSFNLLTKAAYTIKSLQILFLQRTCNFIKPSPVQFFILLCGLDFQWDLCNIQTRQCFCALKFSRYLLKTKDLSFQHLHLVPSFAVLFNTSLGTWRMH